MQNDQQPDGVPAEQEGNWQYTDDNLDTAPTTPGLPSSHQEVSWTASEFIAHNKSVGWYFMLIMAALLAAGLFYFLTNGEIFTPIIIVLAAVLFGVVAARKPRELPYRIDAKGIHIGEKSHSFAEFKSFSVVQEDGVESIWLLPLQRYAPGLSIYFAPTDKERIIAILDDFLPVEERKLDFVDRLMHKIRF